MPIGLRSTRRDMSKPLNEQLNTLAELQLIDGRIFQLEKSLSSQPDEKKALQGSFAQAQGDLKKIDDELKALQVRLKERENELGDKEEKIKKLEMQQMQVKTNREYTAITQEISTLKADQSLVEEEILNLMETVDGKKNLVGQEKKSLAEGEARLQEEMAEMDREADAMKKEVSALKGNRSTFIPGIDKSLLAQYERILKKKEGVAIVPLEGDSCGGCHMSFPPQTVNEILLKESVIVCESCGRILYAPADTYRSS